MRPHRYFEQLETQYVQSFVRKVFYPENGVLHCNYSPLWNALHFVVKVQLGSANYRYSTWNNCTKKISNIGGIEPHSIAASIPHRRQASLWREYLGELRWGWNVDTLA